MAIAKREQQKSIERAEELKQKGVKPTSQTSAKDDKVYASSFLRLLENDCITSFELPRTIRDCRNDVNRFADWLDKHHPDIELKDVDDEVAKAYCTYLSKNFAYSSVKTYRAHLVYTFNKIVAQFKKSPIKDTNPFREFRLTEAVKNKVEGRKDIFTFEQLTYILKRAGENEKHKQPARIQRFAFFYLLIVTGWRVGALAEFKWKDVDFKKRVITNLHGKTEDSTGVHTKIFMTNLMKEVLMTLQELERPREFNPVANLKPAKKRKDAEPEILSYEQVKTIFSFVKANPKHHQFIPVLAIGFFCGARVEERAKLTYCDIFVGGRNEFLSPLLLPRMVLHASSTPPRM